MCGCLTATLILNRISEKEALAKPVLHFPWTVSFQSVNSTYISCLWTPPLAPPSPGGQSASDGADRAAKVHRVPGEDG